jgi:hypothetical protein
MEIRLAGLTSIQTQPAKPHPMQQYDLSPILNPCAVAQRRFANLQFGHAAINPPVVTCLFLSDRD